MSLKHTLSAAITGLITHKSRSFLTILGIVIGIASIMLVVSVGKGAEGIIVGELGGLGAETIVVRPGKEPEGPTDFAETLFADSLKEREFNALLKKQNVPNLVSAAPEVFIVGSVSYRGETFRPTILGFSAELMVSSFGIVLDEGRLFDERDTRSRARVVMLGSRVVDELFAGEDPIGKSVQIKGQKFRVIGTFAPRGQVVFFDIDELVLLPYTTALSYLSGASHYNQIILKAESPEVVPKVVRDVEATLRELHRIEDPADDDFYVQTQQGLVDQVRTILGVFTIFLSLVVAIALIVGGIGVMNIMLVSVTERTREIGLRKALGARNRDILLQFLLEAVILTLVGGILGILLGTLLSVGIGVGVRTFTGFIWAFTFPVAAALYGVGVSGVVGLIFGIYPARQASKKSPIEALRYE